VEYLSLAEIAYQKIKQAILKHEIVPGQRLSHEELVLRLKISQTPIREALSRLAQEGYVTRLTNRGYRVSEMTAEERGRSRGAFWLAGGPRGVLHR